MGRRWLALLLLALAVAFVSDTFAAPRKPGEAFVGMTFSVTAAGPYYIAVTSGGTVYGCPINNATGEPTAFQAVGTVPPGPVNIITGHAPWIFIGYPNGDLYEMSVDFPPPWTFTLVRNVFTP